MTTSAAAPHPARPWLALLPFLAAVAVVAVVGGLAAGSSSATYRALDLPPFAPPSWVFGPVWTVLYVMIAVAGWLAWRAGTGPVGVGAWVVQLALNLAWTPLFFAADRYGWALVDIVALLAAIVATVVLFARVSRAAAWLLAPYLLWVGFATALNAAIVVLN
ncbi:tryptophan-rich sensory protein [Pimelobacter simplex]|uniref:Tryptophan-rich sensory protein n=1 Tax=Nocardioides simplex TaxID=2045 RepID=A0A0A1DMB0_NOCSI|nr:TspO/MBR family protein [Pimelobacter simplex]AIY18521.1 Tryptophan-rich sensory protein [Pimelobacter simplex]MCG8153327.1 tryptophan-rich sensory protein [Pimelobacter simplex]GEB14141.1 tryptophan-rich sensory protein [Pimelobacter simplex]SFM33212.1 TspO and MBR related proteins [Pimelobacter simplex]